MADLQAYRAVLAVGPTVPPKWTDSLPDTRSPSLLSSVYETEGGTKAPPVKATAPDTGPSGPRVQLCVSLYLLPLNSSLSPLL